MRMNMAQTMETKSNLSRIDDLLPAYERLLGRAHEQDITVWKDEKRSTPDHQVWQAVSFLNPFSTYELHLVCNAEGVWVSCTCDAGRFERACKHASRVLEVAGFIGHYEAPEPLFNADGSINGRAALRLLNGADDEWGAR